MGGHFIFEHYLTPAERVFKIKTKIPGKKPEQARNIPKLSWNTLGKPLEHLQDTRNSPEYPPDGPDPDPSGWSMRDLQFFNKYLLPNLMSTVFEEYYS